MCGQDDRVCATYVKSRTGTSSVSTNRSILQVDPAIYLHKQLFGADGFS
jgi:hypothetical protein